jgi:hypothetical protein
MAIIPMNIFWIDPVSINIVLMRVTRLRASPRHGGAGRYPGFFLLIRRGGAPPETAEFILTRE